MKRKTEKRVTGQKKNQDSESREKRVDRGQGATQSRKKMRRKRNDKKKD